MANKRLSKYEKHERSLGQQFVYSFPNKIKQAAFTPPNSYSTYDVFNLSKRIPEWKEKGCPTEIKSMNACTFKNKWEKVEKEVVMLKYDPSIDTLITGTQWK